MADAAGRRAALEALRRRRAGIRGDEGGEESVDAHSESASESDLSDLGDFIVDDEEAPPPVAKRAAFIPAAARPPVQLNKPADGAYLKTVLAQVDADEESHASQAVSPVATQAVSGDGALMTPLVAADGSVDFYILDAHERSGGVVLFGKVRTAAGATVSAALAVSGVLRSVYFLPRPGFTPQSTEEDWGSVDSSSGDSENEAQDKRRRRTCLGEARLAAVEEEARALACRLHVTVVGTKAVTRSYAFEHADVPRGASKWLKMRVPCSSPPIPADASGVSFSRVLGGATGALETLLIKRRIMGPCWVRVAEPRVLQRATHSWCRVEMEASSPKAVTVLRGVSSPLLNAASLVLRTAVVRGTDGSPGHEIVGVSLAYYAAVNVEDGIGLGGPPTARLSLVRASHAQSYNEGPVNVSGPSHNVEKAGDSVVRQVTAAHAAATGMLGGSGRIEVCSDEKAVLTALLSALSRWDPDVLLGHDIFGNALGALYGRIRALRPDGWSRIGRLRISAPPRSGGRGELSAGERAATAGRLVADVQLAAQEAFRAINYSLDTLVIQRLGETRLSDSHPERDAVLVARLAHVLQTLPLSRQLTALAGNLWAHTLRGARAERCEFLLLHEFHAAKYVLPDRREIVRRPGEEDEESGRRKPAYVGGLVLEPRRGLYTDAVLLLDYNSLYPSLIQEDNICFTTVSPAAVGDPQPPASGTPQGVLPRIIGGLVARRRQVKDLMRTAPRAGTPSTGATYEQLDIRQQALKLTANSMYGCLGFAHSRFYARPLAELVTARGRAVLQATVELVDGLAVPLPGRPLPARLRVVYGDTDSVMVSTGTTDSSDALLLATAIKRAVNERHRLLEIDLDSIFERLLLLRKKKYAAVVAAGAGGKSGARDSRRVETKGIDLVRRDWSPLAAEVSQAVLHCVLGVDDSPSSGAHASDSKADSASGMPIGGLATVVPDISSAVSLADTTVAANGVQEVSVADRIHAILDKCKAGIDGLGLERFAITKVLAKDPAAYPDARAQPHVCVALAMRARGDAVHSGDAVPYVVCTLASVNDARAADGLPPLSSSASLAERARHPEEVRLRPVLRVDHAWYLAQQVHPCVSRLVDGIVPGTSARAVAAALGLDAARYGTVANGAASGGVGDAPSSFGGTSPSAGKPSFLLSDEERIRGARPLALRCPRCPGRPSYDAPHKAARKASSEDELCDARWACPTCGTLPDRIAAIWAIHAAVRAIIRAHHSLVSVCDECRAVVTVPGVLPYVCPSLPASGDASAPGPCGGTLREVLPAAALHRQLCAWLCMLKTAPKSWAGEPSAVISDALGRSDYAVIHMAALFSHGHS